MGAALAVLALLAVPQAARAQGTATLDGAPLNVIADGLGAIQVRVDGVASGLFYEPTENPAHAGLEIKEGDRVYPLEDGFDTAPGRVSAGITLSDLGGGTQRLHSEYTVGPNLRVAEDYTLHQRRLAGRGPLRDHQHVRTPRPRSASVRSRTSTSATTTAATA